MIGIRTSSMVALALGPCLVLAVAACGGAEPAAGTVERAAGPTATASAPAPSARPPSQPAVERSGPAPSPGVQPDGEIVSAVAWFHGSLDEALAKARTEGKLVLMDVGAYWCPPCHRLDEEVFVRPEVGQRLGAGYVALHVDAEKGEGPELCERYHVQAYPTVLVLEATGVEKGRIVDFLPAQALLTALDRIEQGGNVLAELALAVENDPDDLAKRYALAHAYLLAADAQAAKPELEAVLVGDPVDELGLASKVLYDRAMFLTYKLEDEPERAIEDFRELQRRFPDSKQAVQAYRNIGRIQCELHRADEAVASLEAMVATKPDDPALAASYGWFSFREGCGHAPALVAVRKGIGLAPEDADLRYVEAELLHALGRDAEALASIRKASELEPKSAFYRRQVTRFQGLRTPSASDHEAAAKEGLRTPKASDHEAAAKEGLAGGKTG
jgi:tetratricopeptide (TPR) repeat protein